jgi:hypothetical protein
MTFVVHVWERPAVDSLAEVDAALATFADRACTDPSPAIDALIAALLRRYPGDIDQHVDDPVWLDSLTGARDPSACLSLGIGTSHVDAVLPFVVEQANALDLNLYDPQAGVLYRPDGQVLRESNAPSRTPARERDVRVALCAALAPFMRRQGFTLLQDEPVGSTFRRRFAGGMHTIELKVGGATGDVRVGATIACRNDVLQSEVDSVLPAPPDQQRDALAGTFAGFLKKAHPGDVERILNRFGAHIRVRFLDEVESIATTLEGYLRNDLIPLIGNVESLDSYWSLAVDERCHGKPVPLDTDVFCQMLAGAVVGDGAWHAIADAEITRVRATYAELEPYHSADSAGLLELRRQAQDLVRFKAYLLGRPAVPECPV